MFFVGFDEKEREALSKNKNPESPLIETSLPSIYT
jgi:hypothetical protein